MPAVLNLWWKMVRRSVLPSGRRRLHRPQPFRPRLMVLESRLAPAGLPPAPPDHVYNVTDGASLAAAVQQADSQSGTSEIILDKADPYTLSAPLNITANMTITGQNAGHPERYVLQPATGVNGPLININGASNVTLRDMTIQGGSTTGDGGGIDDGTTGGQLTLDNMVIQNNSAGDDGGGVYMADGSQLTIANSVLRNNQAGHDGGGAFFNASSQNATVNVGQTSFNNNKAGNDGGGIIVQATPPAGSSSSTPPPAVDATVNATTFVNNTSGDDGGGMWNDDVTQLTADHIFASGNTAVVDSGALGLSVMHLNSASFTFTNGIVVGNQTTGPGSTTTPDAGGVCFDFQTANATGKVTATVTGNLFTNNTVAGAGGGMFLRDNASGTDFSATLAKNSFIANRANNTSPDPEGDAGEGGGLYAEGAAASNQLTLDHNIFAANSAARNGGGLYLRLDSGTADVHNNLFAGNQAGNNGGGLDVTGNTSSGTPGGAVNLSNDGLFGNTAATNGGGLYVDKTGVANLVHDLISFNKAGKAGGGVFNDGGAVTVKDSTITHNTAPTDPNFSGPFTDLGGNTIG